MITEELVDRLVAATTEAKETIRQLHEARRDARLVLKELDEKVRTIRDEVIKANNELAEREWRKAMDSVNLSELSDGLKRNFEKWLELLAEGTSVLEALHEKDERLAASLASLARIERGIAL